MSQKCKTKHCHFSRRNQIIIGPQNVSVPMIMTIPSQIVVNNDHFLWPCLGTSLVVVSSSGVVMSKTVPSGLVPSKIIPVPFSIVEFVGSMPDVVAVVDSVTVSTQSLVKKRNYRPTYHRRHTTPHTSPGRMIHIRSRSICGFPA